MDLVGEDRRWVEGWEPGYVCFLNFLQFVNAESSITQALNSHDSGAWWGIIWVVSDIAAVHTQS